VKRVLVSTTVCVAVLAASLALWQLRTLLVLLVLILVLATAMRPGVEALSARGVPRSIGVLAHYALAAAAVALVIWLVVPPLATQLHNAVQPRQQATGVSAGAGSRALHQLAESVEQRLRQSSVSDIAGSAMSLSQSSLRIAAGIAFVLAGAAYWTLDRDRAQGILTRRLSPSRRRRVLASWLRVERRLGAYVRGQMLLMTIVASVLSFAFWLIGLPYSLAIGIFAGLVEIVPIVGPLLAGLVAVGVGLTVSWQTAALAAACVYGLRLVQDYVIGPRILGHAAGIPPLMTLVWVSIVGVVLGPACVPIATPLACIVVATLEDDEGR
jgi:predicted PurR-regulated permease PerM